MADDELENDGSGKKPLLRYLLLGTAALIIVAVTVLATMFFVSAGPFASDSGSQIEDTIQQLELDAEEARARAEELARGPAKDTLETPELTRFENTYKEMERPLVANIVNSRKVMQVKVAIMTHYDDRVVANIEKHDFAIRSEILDVMRTVDEAKLSEDSFRKELAEKLKMAINSVLEKYEDFGGVEEVLFTEFVVQ